jgi:imidazolonepropionase
MQLLRNIGLLATCRPDGAQHEIHGVRQAALVWADEEIVWVGPDGELPPEFREARAFDAGGGLVVPGLVDCHTHLAFAGWRADELVQRIEGRGYLEIAKAGGGILSTVRATREATEEELLSRCLSFAREMIALGVTTAECKSGYGLTLADELKLLRVYRRLDRAGPLRIVSTFLGAHVVPPEYEANRAGYLRLLIDEMLPAAVAEGLAGFCDVFVEESAFTFEEAKELLEAAGALGLGLKVHADQLTDGEGARLAAEVGAVSAEHLEHVSEDGLAAMAEAGVVAVSLPLAAMYLDQEPLPARRLIDSAVPVAVATDFNPGTAPSFHLPFAMTLACVRQRMTPAEALKGATILAAKAVGMEDRIGSLERGKLADFALIDAADVRTWLYHLRPNACRATVIGGIARWSELPAG